MPTSIPTIVFLTAIPVEYEAVRVHLPADSLVQEWDSNRTKLYEKGDYLTPQQTRCQIIVRQLEGRGNLVALSETKDVITQFQPDYLFFVGIAAKLKDAELGDVVATTWVEGYETGKIQEGEWLSRAPVALASKHLSEIARYVARGEQWQDKIKPVPAPKKPKALVAPIVSGEKVVDSPEFLKRLRRDHGNAAAVEMEGLGFLHAICEAPTVEGIVIRGISDAGENKAETDKQGWQEKAASHAAAFAFAMLDELLDKAKALPVPPNPYPGLKSFRPEDAKNFFGRDLETQQLLTKVLATPLVVVIGASGSGKSSLVFAGLIPALAKQGEWLSLDFRIQENAPGQEPRALVLYASQPAPALVPLTQRFSDTRVPLSTLVKTIFEEYHYQTSLLLVIDQCEELYTVTSDPVLQQRFIDWLLEAVENLKQSPQVKLRIVLTLRVDFMKDGLSYSPFATVLNQGNEMLGPLANADLVRQVIEGPIQGLGVKLEEGLTGRIVQDLQQQQEVPLPLLQFALEKLWEGQQDKQLTHAAYEEIGELKGALSNYAEAQYATLKGTGHEKTLQYIFTQLVHPATNTKRVATIAQIGPANWALVGQLVDARLVVTRREVQSQLETVELVHEALITGWGRLSYWVADSREFRSWQDKLEEDIKRWELTKRDDGALLRGVRLVEAEEKLKEYGEVVTAEERAFIGASGALREKEAQEREQQRQERERLQQRNFRLLAVSFIVVMVLALFGWWQWGEAKKQEEAAKRQSEMAQLRYDGIFNERGAKYQEALDSYLKALNISQNLRDDKAQAFSLLDVGTMYRNLNKFKPALDYFEQALKICKKLVVNQCVKSAQTGISSVLGDLGQLEKAVDFYEQAIGVKEKGHGKFVGYITSFNCPNSAFELFRGTQKLSLLTAIPLYPGDKLKVTEEKCEMRVSLEEKGNILVNMANSPYMVPEISSPSTSILSITSDWLKSLWAQQQEHRMMMTITR